VVVNVVKCGYHIMSSRIGVVTGKHLSHICGEEYSRSMYMFLWLQCEASVMVLDLMMIG
jgi:Mn2+/Fe2+ NRAMP family transporter